MRSWLFLSLFVIFAGAASGQQASDAVAPELAGAGQVSGSGAVAAAQARKAAGAPVEAESWMVVAAHPLAVEAGAEVLAAGGTAADAMVTVQAVLGLVEPQSSGLGGGAFLVWWDAETGELTTLDGRETAPLEATPRLFQDETGQPLQFYDAVVGGRSVGTPGTPALLEEAHRRWGTQSWAKLFQPAITLAEEGFEVSPRLAASIAGDAERLGRFAETAAYFLPGGEPLQQGQRLRNPDYAQTLRLLAGQGAESFYTGDVARDIVQTVRNAPGNPGVLSEADLALYRVKERPAICADYRGYDICGMGPPSSGAVAVGQTLGLLRAYDLAALGPKSAKAWRLIGDASRLAFADRGKFLADTDFIPVPLRGLLEETYLENRSQLLNGEGALGDVQPGAPEFDHALNRAMDASIELPSTSHISIVDSFGNALSMTTTVENAFGARLMVRGFLLNNELTDFSFRTHRDGVPIANRVAPGKRPRSSMAPTIVLEDGRPVLVLGSPGGSRIIPYVSKTLVALLDWEMDAQAAVDLPHLVNRFGTYDVEAGTGAEAQAAALEALGYEVSLRDLTSGLHVIDLRGGGLRGGADPRREGVVLGQ